MTISSRLYQNEGDLRSIQAAVAEWIALAGFRGYMNVSDMALRLFMGNRKYDPGEIVRLWEDADGRVVGCAMVYPPWNSYEVLLHPDYRQHALETNILDWAEREIVHQMMRTPRDNRAIFLHVFDGDTVRSALLEQRHYFRERHIETISICPLDAPIPPQQHPDGFSIRTVEGEQDADQLVACFNDSFGLHWTAEDYRGFMRSPAYSGLTEMVVVAPDGRFASSCILLPDARNRTVMVENVGTGIEFRRMGLAKALLYAGMQRMQAQGFTAAMVPHATEHHDNPSDLTLAVRASTALYTSAGFHPTYAIYQYNRRVTLDGSTPHPSEVFGWKDMGDT